MTQSVKSYSGLDPERCESTFALPSNIAMVLDEAETVEAPEWVETSPEYVANLMQVRRKSMTDLAFGKYFPKGYENARDKAYEELENRAFEPFTIVSVSRKYNMVEVAENMWEKFHKDHCCFPMQLIEGEKLEVSEEDRTAAHVSIIERMKGIEKWKAEQAKVRDGSRWVAHYVKKGKKSKRYYSSYNKQSTGKVDGKWQDAVVYELPPYSAHKTSAKELGLGDKHKHLASYCTTGANGQHEEAQYAFKLNGLVVDLMRVQYREDGVLHNETEKRPANMTLIQFVKAQKKAHPSRTYFMPVMRTSPDSAMQSIAARLGKRMKGGCHTILQKLVGDKTIVPSYLTVWRKERWLTIINWQSDPKLAKSSYGLVNGRVQLCEGDDRMSVSEFDYSLFTDYSDLKIKSEDGEEIRYDYEDDESYMVGMNRDAESDGIDLSKFCDDDDEKELLSFLVFQNELDSINLSNLDGKSAKAALIGEEVEPGKWKGGIKGCRQAIKGLTFLLESAAERQREELEKALTFLTEVQLPKFQRMLRTRENLQLLHSNGIVDYWYPVVTNRMQMMIHPKFLKEPVKVIKGAHIRPDNQIQPHIPIVNEVEKIVSAQTLFKPTLELLQKGILGVCKLSDGTYATKYAKPARIPYTTPKNANPALKATLSRLMAAV